VAAGGRNGHDEGRQSGGKQNAIGHRFDPQWGGFPATVGQTDTGR
jgi:hypothetical protein